MNWKRIIIRKSNRIDFQMKIPFFFLELISKEKKDKVSIRSIFTRRIIQRVDFRFELECLEEWESLAFARWSFAFVEVNGSRQKKELDTILSIYPLVTFDLLLSAY